jgi:hypothetical protein
MPSEHAEIGLGGSTAKRTLNCPGWAALARELPPEQVYRSSPAAEEGTRLHTAIETVLRTGQDPVDEKVARALELFDQLLDDWEVPDDPELILTEIRVELEGIVGAWGTCDVVIDHAPLIIIDWKFGDGVLVSAVDNDQLQYYANGVLDTVFEPDAFDPTDIVVLVIIQPHGREGVDELSTWETTVGDLRAWKTRFSAATEQTHLEPGEWCRWCPAEISCPAIRAVAQRAAFSPPPETAADVAEALTLADLLSGWAASVREKALELMQGGAKVPGYKLVAKRPTARWRSAEDVLQWLKAKRVPVNDAAPRQLLTPAQMRKLLGARKIELDGSLVETKSSGPTIAPESDPRPRYDDGFTESAKIFAKMRQQT